MSDSGKTIVIGGGFPFASVLALVFITLKLLGHITWSWWWVLSPIWIPALIFFALVAFVVLASR